MAGFGLSKVINGDILRRFSSLAATSKPLSQALSGSTGVQTSLGAGLRVGARTYSTALDGLNSAVSIVNLSERTLQDLGKLTDKLIDVTRRATDVATSRGTRQALAVEFRQLANEFKRTVRNATTGDNEFLSADGLEEVFRSIGLDKNSSRSIAEIFSRFVTGGSDQSLASENIRGGEPVIPLGAFRTRLSDAQYRVTRMQAEEVKEGSRISSVNFVYRGTDDTLNQNPGYDTLLTRDTNGNLTALAANTLSADIRLLSVNEENGYSVIASTADFLGTNAGGVEQLYLVDNSGAVVHQYTVNASADVTYQLADISSDNLTIAYALSEGGAASLNRAQFSELGGSAESVETLVEGEGFTKLVLSNSGNYLAFTESGGTSYFYDAAAGSSDAAFESESGSIVDYGFLDDGTLAVLYQAESGRQVLSWAYEEGGGPDPLVEPSDDVSKIAVLEGYGFAFYTAESARLIQYDSTGVLERSVQFDSGDSVSSFSLALNRSGSGIDIGVYAITSVFGSEGKGYYRISDNPDYTRQRTSARGTPALYDSITDEQRTSIFDESYSIEDRAQAHRTLKRLQGLKEQIDKNLSALAGARSTLESTIELVRNTGKAFLEMAERIRGLDDAEKVARQLSIRIRSSSSSALAQADNLNAITVAALTSGNE